MRKLFVSGKRRLLLPSRKAPDVRNALSTATGATNARANANISIAHPARSNWIKTSRKNRWKHPRTVGLAQSPSARGRILVLHPPAQTIAPPRPAHLRQKVKSLKVLAHRTAKVTRRPLHQVRRHRPRLEAVKKEVEKLKRSEKWASLHRLRTLPAAPLILTMNRILCVQSIRCK